MHISIIIPVLNEEVVLAEMLSYLTTICAGHECELLIVDGGSRDATVAIARKSGRVIEAARGRASQMNAGAAAAAGDVLLFLHADTRLPPDAFVTIKQALTPPEVVGGAFRVRFDRADWPYRLVSSTTNLRSRLRHIFTGDQAYFIRSASFHAIGGFAGQPIMEDIEIIARLRNIGRFVLVAPFVTTSARRHTKFGLLRSVLFMWSLRTLYMFGVAPATLQRIYIDIR
jgi:rSAM/selenodomain-associated transferase 2